MHCLTLYVQNWRYNGLYLFLVLNTIAVFSSFAYGGSLHFQKAGDQEFTQFIEKDGVKFRFLRSSSLQSYFVDIYLEPGYTFVFLEGQESFSVQERDRRHELRMQWPYPTLIQKDFLGFLGYEEHLILPIEILKEGKIVSNVDQEMFQGRYQFQVCDALRCFPHGGDFVLDFQKIPGNVVPQDTFDAMDLEGALKSIPQKIDFLELQKLKWKFKGSSGSDPYNQAGQLVFLVDIEGLQEILLFPVPDDLVFYPQGKQTVVQASYEKGLGQPGHVFWKASDKIYQTSLEGDDFDSLTVMRVSALIESFYGGLLLAFLGGLFLNCMPCSWPLICMKLVHIFTTQESPRFYFLKLIAGCFFIWWGLGGLFLFLPQVFWGEHFQNPYVLMVVLMIFSVLTVSMLRGKSFLPSFHWSQYPGLKAWEPFFWGCLTALTSTACAVPIIGPVVGYAVLTGSFFLIFMMVGLGLAFPYIVMFIYPQWTLAVPSLPREWMKYVQGGVLFFAFAFFVWMIFILRALIPLESFIVFCGGLLWIMGSDYLPDGIKLLKNRRYAGTVCVLGIGIVMFQDTVFNKNLREEHNSVSRGEYSSEIASERNVWKPFSAQAFADYQAKGMNIYVRITAKWCLTCHLNVVRLYDTQRFQKCAQALTNNHGFVFLKGDWTQKNEDIRKYLAGLDVQSLPLDGMYTPDYPQGYIFPEMISWEDVHPFFRQCQSLEKA